MYDAYNVISGSDGAEDRYWDVGFINVWSNTAKNFTSGKIDKLFSDLGEGISIGNPTFAKNSPYIVAFDYIESTDLVDNYYILGANLQTGDITNNSNGIFANNTLGVPSFSKTDNRILFTTEDAAGKTLLRTIAMASNKIDPATTNTLIRSDAQKGNLFANGIRSLTSSTNDKLDKTAVKIAPNPFNDNVTVEVSADKTGSGMIEIFDLLGRKINQTPLNIAIGKNSISLPTPSLQAGTYLLKVTVDSKSLTTKIVKL